MIYCLVSFLTGMLVAFDPDKPFSLFNYDLQQEEKILSRRAAKQVLYLTGITYTSSKNWGIWLNEDYYDPTKQPTHFQILKVMPTSVTIRLQAVEMNVSLSLGDGVCSKSGRIYRKFV